MLELPDVSLVAFGTTNIEGMKKALFASQKGISFGAVKMITEVPCDTIDEWNKNIVFRLGEFVDTPFALLIHPDGYVVEPEAWDKRFLEYDYIGSPWPYPTDDYSYRDGDGNIQRVGNSVSLRSKKLLDLPKKVGLEWKSFHGNTNEDGAICVNFRHIFEQHGCKFAPLELAVKFGREHEMPENSEVENTFVFHKHYSERNYQYEIYE